MSLQMRDEDTVGCKWYLYAEIGPFLTLFCAIAEELRLCKNYPQKWATKVMQATLKILK
jgi:hypothetical protein